jgi:hypothetical protein
MYEFVGARQLVEQIKEREQVKLNEKEEKEKDNMMMKNLQKMLEREEKEDEISKIERSKALAEEIEKSNTIAISQKDFKKNEAKEEDQRIVDYNRKKAEQEEDWEQEKRYY